MRIMEMPSMCSLVTDPTQAICNCTAASVPLRCDVCHAVTCRRGI